MLDNVEFLLVSCCKEKSRLEILEQCVKALLEQFPDAKNRVLVFDNDSTEIGTIDLLKQSFSNVYVSNKNVGYWSAIDWWLKHLLKSPPTYTYIIESDMIHYDFMKLQQCVSVLDKDSSVGSIRLHQYSVLNRHLYNKDRPVQGSKTNIWQSHTNKVSGKPVEFFNHTNNVHVTNFLTQLPALNRYETMVSVFEKLNKLPQFSELDFQRLYFEKYNLTGILDGGIFHSDDACYGSKTITGSWSNPDELKKIGYQNTRYSSITSIDQYIVSKA